MINDTNDLPLIKFATSGIDAEKRFEGLNAGHVMHFMNSAIMWKR